MCGCYKLLPIRCTGRGHKILGMVSEVLFSEKLPNVLSNVCVCVKKE